MKFMTKKAPAVFETDRVIKSMSRGMEDHLKIFFFFNSRFFTTVAQYMRNRYKAVYAATAEVVGMIFKHLAEKDRQTEGTFHDYVVNLMNSLQQSNPGNFLLCIHRMHLHYPPIADR